MVNFLPRGARPDLGVDGLVQLEKMTNTLYVGRPINGQAESAVKVFKVSADGTQAYRAAVRFGRTSVSTIAVLEGLAEGDQIITSDMAQWDGHDKVRLR
jgi:HlyD family secretion protein